MPRNKIRQTSAGSRFLLPKKSSPNAKVIPLSANGHLLFLEEEGGTLWLRDVVCVVAMVIVELLAAVPFSITVDREKLHDELIGSPEQEKDTA